MRRYSLALHFLSEREHTMPRLHRNFCLLFLLFCCLSALFSFIAVSLAHSTLRSPPLMRAGTAHYTYQGHRNAITAVAWSPNGKRIASASYDKIVQIWDPLTGRLLVTYHGHSNWVTAVVWW
jgi:WD40 repeat protein